MALANYTDLVASIASWMNRSDLASVIPDFIRIAESRMDDQIRIRQGIVSATLTATPGVQEVALPSDWLEFKELNIDGLPLELSTADVIRENSKRIGSRIWKYAIEGDVILLSPTPGTTPVQIAIKYYAKIPPLQTSITNWMLTKNPNIYLYGSLVSGYQYLLNDERANYWGLLYTQAVRLADANDKRAISSGSPLTIRVRK
jgi:hypothetical protein